MRRPHFTWLAVLLVISAPAAAAENPLDAFPEDTGLVLRWKRPTETFQKAIDFASAVKPAYGAQLKQLQPALGIAISNPGLAGVDRSGDWWVAVFPSSEAEPGILFAVPAQDSEKMKEAIAGEYRFIEYDKWLLYTDDQELADGVEKHIAQKEKSLSKLIDEESAALLGRGELSLFLNAPQLWTTYKQDLENARDELESTLAQMQGMAAAGPTPGMNVQAVFNVYIGLFRGLLKAFEDTQGVAAAMTVNDKGVSLEKYVRLKAGSDTDKLLQPHDVAALKALSKLPTGQQMYLALHGDLKKLADWGIDFASSFYTNAQTPEVKTAIEKAKKNMKEAKFGGVYTSVGIVDSPQGAFRVASVVQVDPAAKLREPFRELTKSMGTVKMGFLEQTTELEADAEKFGEHSADLVTTRQEVDPQVDPSGAMQEMYRAMYGPDGMVQRLVYLDDKLVHTMGGGRQPMQRLLTSLASEDAEPSKNGETSEATEKARKAAAAVRGQLSERANVILLIDIPGYVGRSMAVAFQAMPVPIPIDLEGLAKLGEEPSYLGLSVSREENAVRARAYLPLEQARSISRMVDLFQSMQAGPGF